MHWMGRSGCVRTADCPRPAPEHAIFHGQYSRRRATPRSGTALRNNASSFGFFLRAWNTLSGSCFSSSAPFQGFDRVRCVSHFLCDSTLNVKLVSVVLPPVLRLLQCPSNPVHLDHTHVHQDIRQTSRTGFARRTRIAPLLHLAFPFLFRDTAYYEELARNWLYHHVYGFTLTASFSPRMSARPAIRIPGSNFTFCSAPAGARSCSPSLRRSWNMRAGRRKLLLVSPTGARWRTQPRRSGLRSGSLLFVLHRQHTAVPPRKFWRHFSPRLRSYFSVAGGMRSIAIARITI